MARRKLPDYPTLRAQFLAGDSYRKIAARYGAQPRAAEVAMHDGAKAAGDPWPICTPAEAKARTAAMNRARAKPGPDPLLLWRERLRGKTWAQVAENCGLSKDVVIRRANTVRHLIPPETMRRIRAADMANRWPPNRAMSAMMAPELIQQWRAAGGTDGSLAAASGLASGTLWKLCRPGAKCYPRTWQKLLDAVNAGPPAKPQVPDRVHGTFNGYQHYGCRCIPCTAANTETSRLYRRRKKENR